MLSDQYRIPIIKRTWLCHQYDAVINPSMAIGQRRIESNGKIELNDILFQLSIILKDVKISSTMKMKRIPPC